MNIESLFYLHIQTVLISFLFGSSWHGCHNSNLRRCSIGKNSIMEKLTIEIYLKSHVNMLLYRPECGLQGLFLLV